MVRGTKEVAGRTKGVAKRTKGVAGGTKGVARGIRRQRWKNPPKPTLFIQGSREVTCRVKEPEPCAAGAGSLLQSR